MLSSRPDRPPALRMYSATERAKYMLGRGARLTVEQVYEIAAMATGGLTDPGVDRYFEEGLNEILESARQADLTSAGRRILNDFLWMGLARRLKMADQKKRHPEVFDVPLRRPFIIMGMARTGTTLLHRLLSLDPGAYGPPRWELDDPFPPAEGPDGRREQAWGYHRERKKKNTDNVHFSDPDTPEECTILLASQFVSVAYWGLGPLYEYADWLLDVGVDLGPAVYRDYRDYLLHLQSEHPGMTLSLKSPEHNSRLGVIQELIPDAMIIHTVRHPLAWSNSSHSLVYQYHSATSRKIDVPRLVEASLSMMQAGYRANIAARSEESPIIDVLYDDIVNKPIDVVRSIYAFYGVDWPDDHEATLQRYLDGNQKAKHGAHTYSSADFGLTDGQVTERFSDYIDFFNLSKSS